MDSQQITEAFPWNEAPRYLIRDRDGIYGAAATHSVVKLALSPDPLPPNP
jgi:hypothetical protein